MSSCMLQRWDQIRLYNNRSVRQLVVSQSPCKTQAHLGHFSPSICRHIYIIENGIKLNTKLDLKKKIDKIYNINTTSSTQTSLSNGNALNL